MRQHFRKMRNVFTIDRMCSQYYWIHLCVNTSETSSILSAMMDEHAIGLHSEKGGGDRDLGGGLKAKPGLGARDSARAGGVGVVIGAGQEFLDGLDHDRDILGGGGGGGVGWGRGGGGGDIEKLNKLFDSIDELLVERRFSKAVTTVELGFYFYFLFFILLFQCILATVSVHTE
jgi:hypothetical protein